jgi:hypothetical protein
MPDGNMPLDKIKTPDKIKTKVLKVALAEYGLTANPPR